MWTVSWVVSFQILGISSEQRGKLSEQKSQYGEARTKLEGQLLKLKEQREALKAGGAKHEDNIMKENARLQVGKRKENLHSFSHSNQQPLAKKNVPKCTLWHHLHNQLRTTFSALHWNCTGYRTGSVNDALLFIILVRLRKDWCCCEVLWSSWVQQVASLFFIIWVKWESLAVLALLSWCEACDILLNTR